MDFCFFSRRYSKKMDPRIREDDETGPDIPAPKAAPCPISIIPARFASTLPDLRQPCPISVIPAKAGIHPRLPSARFRLPPCHAARLHAGNGRLVVTQFTEQCLGVLTQLRR